MKNELTTGAIEVQDAAKPRKAYHTPRIENYGAVNELTRSGTPPPWTTPDGSDGYTSA